MCARSDPIKVTADVPVMFFDPGNCTLYGHHSGFGSGREKTYADLLESGCGWQTTEVSGKENNFDL